MAATTFDLDLFAQAGINPKTIMTSAQIKAAAKRIKNNALKGEIKKNLRILDEQNAVNKFVWYNLPGDLDGQLIERILYYRGQGAFFQIKDQFYFLPYALDGEIDVYGRFRGITPLPFNGTASETQKEYSGKPKPWITGLHFNPLYAIPDDVDINIWENSCVLLSDYTKQISQTNIARKDLVDPILGAMAEAYPMARTSLISNSGVKGIRVNNQDQADSVIDAANGFEAAATNGNPWIPIVGDIDFQELGDGSALKSEEFLLYMQSLDSFRLSLHGLKNGGIFQKKAHMLESENEMNDGNVGLVMQDQLTLRQRFCDIVNSVWGLGIWVEPSEVVVGLDRNLDMAVMDQDAAQPGMSTQDNVGGGEDE